MFYLAVTADEYELPVAVYESLSEICRKLKYSRAYTNYWISHSENGIIYLRKQKIKLMRLDEDGQIIIGKLNKGEYV